MSTDDKFTYWCWEEENGNEEDAREVRSYAPFLAAEQFAKSRWSDDYPEEQRIGVRDSDGVVRRFVVRAETVLRFTAMDILDLEARPR